MQVINHTQAEELMRSTGGKLFAVRFNKRSNGAPRRMTCRLGVRKGVTGEGKKFNDSDHNLLTVHEFVTGSAARDNQGRFVMGAVAADTQFRSVPLERVTWLRVRGREYQVQ